MFHAEWLFSVARNETQIGVAVVQPKKHTEVNEKPRHVNSNTHGRRAVGRGGSSSSDFGGIE